MTGIELVPAGLVHAELLAGMHKVCFAEPWSARSMQDVLAMPGTQALLAVAGDAPAGLVVWRAVLDESEILTIAVLPPWRRAGLGGRLMESAAAAAAQAGAATMFLEVSADNMAAQTLYRRLGFESVGLRKAYYNGIDALAMRKGLGLLMKGA